MDGRGEGEGEEGRGNERKRMGVDKEWWVIFNGVYLNPGDFFFGGAWTAKYFAMLC